MDSAVDDAFKVVEESVHYNNAKANEAFRYLLGAVLALAIAGLIEGGLVYLVGLTAQTRPILLAALAGGVGAVVSVLQRISSLEISPFAPLWYACLQGMARVVLGVLFGAFFALANKANLALGTFAENLYLRHMFLQSGPYVDRVLQSSADQRLTADAESRHTERATADKPS